MTPEFVQQLQHIQLLICDVDGVLTDGKIWLDDRGVETKCFDTQDGLGIRLLQRGDIDVAVLTGRTSQVVARRAADLHIQSVIQGAGDKRSHYQHLKESYGYDDTDIAYVGDDLVDIPVLNCVGTAFAVPNAVAEVKAVAHYVTSVPGGQGAVREIAELILKAQNRWERLIQDLYS